MKYEYIHLASRDSIDSLFERINENLYIPIEEKWYMNPELTIHGYYHNRDIGPYSGILFDFSKSISPNETKEQMLSAVSHNIFATLKVYGSSGKYHGLADVNGKTIIPNNYERISLFVEFGYRFFFLVERHGYMGVIDKDGKVIIPIKYKNIFEAGEFTIGFEINDKIGFMNLDGVVTIPAKYKIGYNYNTFLNGKALVCLDSENGIPHFIDHYGVVVGYPEESIDNTWDGSTAYNSDNDILDAYEGDYSNMWNTD